MDHYRVNLFEIEEPSRIAFEYRLVEIEGLDRATISNADLLDRNTNLLAKLVAIREKCPVAVVYKEGRRYLAIPAVTILGQFEYQLAPDVVTLKPLEERYPATLLPSDATTRHVAGSFLGFCLRGPLRKHPSLWSSSTNSFVSKRPVNANELNREVDLFEGFHFHLRYYENRLFVGIRLAYKYVDVAWAVDRFTVEELRNLRMRMFLYHFGKNWYPIQLMDVLSKSIGETRFVPDRTGTPISVYDYTVAEAGENAPPWIKALDPSKPAILYRNSGRDRQLFAALALAKLIHRTDDPTAQRLHRRSIKNPADRLRFSGQVIQNYFQKRSFLGTELRISNDPLRVRPRLYSVPALEFGQGRKLHIGGDPEQGGVHLRELGRTRMGLLSDPNVGPAVTSTLEPQYILVPQSLDRSIATDAAKRMETVTRSFLHGSYRLETVVYDDRSARTLKQQVEAIVAGLDRAKVGHGRGVLVLPAKSHADLHNYVKKALRDRFEFQCLDATKLAGFFCTVLRKDKGSSVMEPRPELERKFSSYLRYAALGLLIVNRQWGWVLADGTHYDGYISFDVLNRQAAFTFFYHGGRDCYTKLYESNQREKLLRRHLRTIIYDGLKADAARLKKLRSIVLQRDGRLFETEWLGFQDAIQQLISEGVLESNVRYGAIEIAKALSSGLRLVQERNGSLENPRIGAALAIASDEGIVCNTGFPFDLPGTAGPLAVRVVHGDLNLDFVMEDIFRKSLLCWPTPDKCMRLPIDAKLCDEFLRALASEANEEEAQWGEEEEGTASVA